MTSATEELRRLLDERGVEHYDHENGEPLRVLKKAEGHATSWRIDGASYCAVPDGKGTFDVWIDHCTPEQAIAATLGDPGVLHICNQPDTDYAAITAIEVDGQRFERVKECELEHHDTGWVSCRECNTSWKNDRPYVYRRCPYCGAKVVDE